MATSEALRDSLFDLGRLLVVEAPLPATLERVAELAQQAFGGCDMASLTVLDHGRPSTPAATHESAVILDDVQYRAGDGPCLTATTEGGTHVVDDTAAEARWPEYVTGCIDHGVASSMSVPLELAGRRLGALNLYGRRTHAFPRDDRAGATSFGAHAAATLVNAQTYWRTRVEIDQLRSALDGRDVIGQAKGIIMARQAVTADEAFDLLRRASQRTNVKLRDLARQVALDGVVPVDPDDPAAEPT